MAGQAHGQAAWLESSLRRSASLGREVLQRATRRSVDWTISTAPSRHQSPTTTTTHEDHGWVTQDEEQQQRTHADMEEVFATLAGLMAQTTYQCKCFYGSDCCSEATDAEKLHVSRFHTRPTAGMITPAMSTSKQGCLSEESEDYRIDVSPGTYAITASMQDAEQQTQLVSVRAGQSVKLTFDL